MKILAVDYGDSRTGLATCDRTEFLTSPITPQITVKARDKVAARVCEVAKEIEAELIVIGLPLNMDGTEGERARKSRKLAKTVEIWSGLPAKNTRAVILDLRGNGGGLIDAALKMANAMTPVKDAELAGVRYRDDMGGLEQTYSTGNALPLGKIVVLVDGGTASAAELLAGSLQDTGSATLIGSKTYGKGQGQFHIDLVNGDKLVITTLELELPKQGCWEGVGLTPDIQLENRKVTVNTKDLKPLDTSTTLRFGDSSDAVYAMTERLSLLGLLTEATGRYDGDVADAVASFRAAYDLPAALYASPEMLSALDEAVTALNGQTYLVDDQLQSALEMCRLAAAKPQKYIVKSDGSWAKK